MQKKNPYNINLTDIMAKSDQEIKNTLEQTTQQAIRKMEAELDQLTEQHLQDAKNKINQIAQQPLPYIGIGLDEYLEKLLLEYAKTNDFEEDDPLKSTQFKP